MARMIMRDWSTATEEELLRGYEEMAADTEAEKEALEWCESHIGECLEDDEGRAADGLFAPITSLKP